MNPFKIKHDEDKEEEYRQDARESRTNRRCKWCCGTGTESSEGRLYSCPDCNGTGKAFDEDGEPDTENAK